MGEQVRPHPPLRLLLRPVRVVVLAPPWAQTQVSTSLAIPCFTHHHPPPLPPGDRDSHLRKKNENIENLIEDFENGSNLLKLINVLFPDTPSPKLNKNTSMRPMKLDNCVRGLWPAVFLRLL